MAGKQVLGNSMQFTTLNQIKGDADGYIIKVKIIHSWNCVFGKNVTSLDMIFMDEKGFKIIATVKKHLLADFEHLLGLGNQIIVSKFAVAAYDGKFKIVDHDCKINFFKTTRVVPTSDFNIEVDKSFDFVKYKDVNDYNVTPEFAFDVIGRVVTTQDLKIIKEDTGEKKILNCELMDLSGENIPCGLWGEFGEKLHKYIQDQSNSANPVIILLQIAKINRFKENPPWVSNCLFGSKLYINDDLPEIKNFIASLSGNEKESTSSDIVVQLSSSTSIYNPADSYTRFPFKHLDEILEFDKPTSACVFVGKIKRVERENGWWYLACRNCTMGVTENPAGSVKKYKCTKCSDVSDVFRRIKIYLRVQDKTATCSVTLFEREALKMIKDTRSNIFKKMDKAADVDAFTDDFEQLLEKVCVFKISVSKFNIENNYSVLTVNRLTDNEEVVKAILMASPHIEDTISEGDVQTINMDASQSYNDGKEVFSVTSDNGTPLEKESSTASSPNLKRGFSDSPVDVHIQSSTSKALPFSQKLKIPKVEKD